MTTAKARRILLVEDERTIANILADYLRQAGFIAEHCEDGRVAVGLIRSSPPDLVVLDIMLPGLGGMSVCREVRAFSSVPIIMVTARAEEMDRLLGLDLGADDYICKPFSPREVVARIKAVLRRMARPPENVMAETSRLAIDDETQRVIVAGQTMDLTPTEFRLLRLLAARPGRIYSRSAILDGIYRDDADVSDRIIDSHIKNIRRKLAAVLPDVDFIHSAYGVGYCFEAQDKSANKAV